MSEMTAGQAGAARVDSVQSAYMAMTRRKRLYGSVMLIVFVAMMVSGFQVADSRNAGGFWDGITNIFQFPSEVLAEAGEKIANLPGLMWDFLPSLIETINIAAASTLLGAMGAVLISLLATRGLAKWPRLIGLFRRVMDILRAVPEIVIALVLIFILGGGPVPAMIAIALHTIGALGELFSDWGIPTPEAIRQASNVDGLTVVGSGGGRSGRPAA